jgi:hypothetical protein
MFAMSGDGKQDIHIPIVFLFNTEGLQLLSAMKKYSDLEVYIGLRVKPAEEVVTENLDAELLAGDVDVPEPACPATEVIRHMRLLQDPSVVAAIAEAQAAPSLGSLMGKYSSYIGSAQADDSTSEEGKNEMSVAEIVQNIIDTAQLRIGERTFQLSAILKILVDAGLTDEAVRTALVKAVQTASTDDDHVTDGEVTDSDANQNIFGVSDSGELEIRLPDGQRLSADSNTELQTTQMTPEVRQLLLGELSKLFVTLARDSLSLLDDKACELPDSEEQVREYRVQYCCDRRWPRANRQ